MSMKLVLLINPKLLKIIIANSFLPKTAEHESLSTNIYENAYYCWLFSYLLAEKISCSFEFSIKNLTSRLGQQTKKEEHCNRAVPRNGQQKTTGIWLGKGPKAGFTRSKSSP